MSITITIPDLQLPVAPRRINDLGQLGRHLLPLLTPVLLPLAEDLVPGLGALVAVAALARVEVSS